MHVCKLHLVTLWAGIHYRQLGFHNIDSLNLLNCSCEASVKFIKVTLKRFKYQKLSYFRIL